jgi:hypothetical protein
MVDNSHGLCHLLNILVKFGDFGKVPPPTLRALHNNKFPCHAQQIIQFSWAMYSFHGGHIASTIQSQNLPFCISIVCAIPGICAMPSHIQQCK